MNKLTGAIIVLTDTILYALLGPLLKKANMSFQPFTVMAFSMFSLFLFSFIMSIVFEHSLSINLQKEKNTIYLLLIVGLINGVAFWFGIKGYKYMSLSQQSLFALLSPIFVAIFAYLILGEKIDPKIFISLLIMAIGIVVSFV